MYIKRGLLEVNFVSILSRLNFGYIFNNELQKKLHMIFSEKIFYILYSINYFPNLNL